jgi:glucosamine--fructose-6-phosphate aminotransferase (isomerizing)
MSKADVLMAAELRETTGVVSRQSLVLGPPLRELANRLRANPPRFVVTCARGSSAHAATFGKYLIERYLGIPVSAAAPSITTVYKRRLRLDGQLFVAISQSGRSDDLVEATASARGAGALTAAILNDTESPLASVCDIVVPMTAGREQSVAATKTFIASLTALLNLIDVWADVPALGPALDRLPQRLAQASHLDWTHAGAAIANARSLVTLGRGPTLAIAQEAGLKLKEVCDIHAEAFSGAEFQHGPIALVSRGYPVLIFMPSDMSAEPLQALATDLREKQAMVFTTGNGSSEGWQLPAIPSDCAETDAICLIQTFYGLAIHLASHRGVNIDRPRHLKKITRTR